MKISNEMYNSILNSKEKVIVINDDYVLLHKKMPCSDDKLDDYINSLNKLNKDGVNVSNIVDYRLIDGTTTTYSNGISYTSGVFLEKRAKGNCIADVENISLRTDKVYDFKIVSYMFDKLMDYYVSELEKRAFAKQEMFDKLVNDYVSFNKYGLEPDPKPLNFFFDPSLGFTIIDVIPSSNEMVEEEYLSRYIIGVVAGYTVPKISINYENLNLISKKYKDRIDRVVPLLEEKIIEALVKVGIDKDNILSSLINLRNKYNSLNVINEDLENYVENIFNSKKEGKVVGDNNDKITFSVN